MPKIKIKERDLTTNPSVALNLEYILYVKAGILDSNEAPRLLKEEDLSKVKDNDKDFFELALKLGGKIIIAKDWEDAKNYCSDRNQYDVKFILAKEGDTYTSTKTVKNEAGEETTIEETKYRLEDALDIAQKRKDCVVIYTKINPNYTTNITESNLLKLNCNYIENSEFFSDEVKTAVGKYVLAFYAPGNLHKEKNANLDAGKGYILALLNNVAKGKSDYLAVAGKERGIIPGNYIVDSFLKEEDIDNMQLRNYDENNLIAINPIVNMNPWGTRIWGNRTCLPNNNVTDENNKVDEKADQLVGSSFANIRIAICDIKKALYKAARKYQFEQNTDVLWVNFTSEVNSLLEEMKSSYGIVGYRWKRDSVNEQRGELRAILQIQPIEAVEDFTITCELKDSLEDNIQIAE